MSCYCFMDPLMHLVGWMLHRDRAGPCYKMLRRDQELVPEFRDRLAKWADEIEQGRIPDFQDRELLVENLGVAKNGQFSISSSVVGVFLRFLWLEHPYRTIDRIHEGRVQILSVAHGARPLPPNAPENP